VDTTVLGYFHDRAAADAAYHALVQQGIPKGAISVLGRGAEGDARPTHDEGATAATGAGVGAIEGLLLGAAAMLIPGVGPIVAVGPLAAAVAGALTGGVTGAVVGGVVGGLEAAGVERDTARYYDERLREGGVLVAVHADPANADAVQTILARHGADLRNLRAVEGTPDWPGGEAVALDRNERREYLGAPEDIARTTAARDPDELLPVEDDARPPNRRI
jgi:hypothetical protein